MQRLNLLQHPSVPARVAGALSVVTGGAPAQTVVHSPIAFLSRGFPHSEHNGIPPTSPPHVNTRCIPDSQHCVTCTRHFKGHGLAANPRSGNADDPNDDHHRRSVCTGRAGACDGAEVSRRDATRTTLIAIALRFAAEHALPHAQAGDGLGVRKACCKLPFRVELFRGGSSFRVVLAMNRGASAQ